MKRSVACLELRVLCGVGDVQHGLEDLAAAVAGAGGGGERALAEGGRDERRVGHLVPQPERLDQRDKVLLVAP